MKLRCMVIADPKAIVSDNLADQCDRLADARMKAHDAEQTLAMVADLQPEILVLSLELPGAQPQDLVPRLLELAPNLLVVATFRELSVPAMKRLMGLGVEDFVPQPVDPLELFRAASRRFNVPFRRHDRWNITLEVFRADGVLIGKTVDLSEGGLSMAAFHPVAADDSILADLALPDSPKPLRIRCQVLNVEGRAPMQVTARMQFIKLWGKEQQRLAKYLGGLGPPTQS